MAQKASPQPSTEIFVAARKLLVERGWGRGFYGPARGGPYCALGAIMGASLDQGVYDRAKAAFIKANHGIESVAEWNDDPARALEQVLEAFDKAIVLQGA